MSWRGKIFSLLHLEKFQLSSNLLNLNSGRPMKCLMVGTRRLNYQSKPWFDFNVSTQIKPQLNSASLLLSVCLPASLSDVFWTRKAPFYFESIKVDCKKKVKVEERFQLEYTGQLDGLMHEWLIHRVRVDRTRAKARPNGRQSHFDKTCWFSFSFRPPACPPCLVPVELW